MSPELDKELCEKYPKIFAERNGSVYETAMCWGFEHDDGWHKLIDCLCGNIQNRIDFSIRSYEKDIVYNAMIEAAQNGDMSKLENFYKGYPQPEKFIQDALKQGLREIAPPIPQVVAKQVKEKFGTLRFYYEGGNDYIDGMIAMAEAMSAHICETCGKPGTLRGRGWLYTACDEHAREKNQNDE
jgi:hypothetical protein